MRNTEKGQTLIEALISLSIAVVVVSAITVVVLSSLNNATFTKNQNQATLYAQEGMEITKRIALSENPKFNSIPSSTYCLDEGKTILDEPLIVAGAGGCNFNVKGKYSREIQIEHTSNECSNKSQVTVGVKWSDNKCTTQTGPFCHEVELSSCISGYNPSTSGPAPL